MMNRTNPWLVYLLPFLVFSIFSSIEPTKQAPGGLLGLSIPYSAYPLVYTLKIGLTLAAVAYVFPGYRSYAFRIHPLAVTVGVVGVFLWIGICHLDLEHRFLKPLLDKIGMGSFIGAGDRAGFNPLKELAEQPAWAWTFLGIRFLGLVLVVPLIEEVFLRGFVMRFAVNQDWWTVPFGQVNRLALVLGTVVPMLTHPGELFAAAVWFSMVTWLMLRTKNLYDCITAHAVTNLLLGVYVVVGGYWRLM